VAAVAELRIVIEDGPNVRVAYTPAHGQPEEIRSQPLNIPPIQRRTVQFLATLLRDGRLKEKSEYEVLGANLFATLFYDERGTGLSVIGAKLGEAMRAARVGDDDGLLQITLDFQESRNDLSSWPWEYLFSPERQGDADCNFFIGQRTRMALTRYIGLANAVPAKPPQEPLKVLLVAPSSDEFPVEPAGVLEALEQLNASGQIQLSRLPAVGSTRGRRGIVTFGDFTGALGWEPAVIHFVGHGKHKMAGDRAVGSLAFTDETGERSIWVPDQDIANTLADTRSLHLVFLQACESADTQTMSSYQTIAGVAQSVSQKSVPAVVAMHYRLQSAVGNALSRAFYEKLAERRSVLSALNHARTQVLLDEMWAAFGLPVLYLRGTGVIFESDAPLTQNLRRAASPSRRSVCPWDGDVDMLPDASTCPTCRRVLICPECEHPREWKSDKCRRCEQRVFNDAEPGLPPESRYDESRARAGDQRLGGALRARR
jgi:CHAT domain